MNPQPLSIMQTLKQETAVLHREAEGTGFQQALARGRLPREQYVASLAQLRHIHATLDSALQRLAKVSPVAATVVHPRQFQTANLDADLRTFDADLAEHPPLDATQRLVRTIEQTAKELPLALLGVHYVLEGSKNGGRYLAEPVRRAYGLSETGGARYLDPHGDEQRAFWGEFRAAMDTADFLPNEREAIVAAARTTFLELTRMYDAVFSAASMPDAAVLSA